MRYLIALIAAATLSIVGFSYASAAVGDEEICVAPQPGTTDKVTDISDGDAQTFTTTNAFILSGVKLNIYRSEPADTNIIEIAITDVSGSQPDMTSILATETVDVSTLPIDGAVNNFSCTKTNQASQLVEFDPPVSLNGSTSYAIVITHDSGTPTSTDIVHWMYTSGDDNYAGGLAWECNAPTSCTLGSPATWDLVLSPTDYGFALYNNIVDPDEGRTTADAWIIQALDAIGLNTYAGKIFAGIVAVSFFFLGMISMKVPALPALGIAGFVGGSATLMSLFEPWMMLSVIAVIGVAIVILIFSMFGGRGASDG